MTPGAFAEALTATPQQTEGPFYPDKLPLDTDNDLIVINDSITPAIGEITHLYGTVRNATGSPVRNAVVEIWQADMDGNYIHSRSRGGGNRDANFQGYGRFLTGSTGEYFFRCIKPTPYGRRTPHIHVAVNVKGKRVLTTQCYVRDHELNRGDRILNNTPADVRDLLICDFTPIPNSRTGELTAQFDMVIGITPED
ncbi:MAG: protocatechuate 3,4-dioxygenase, partial [Verrucomicrobiota bacterium]